MLNFVFVSWQFIEQRWFRLLPSKKKKEKKHKQILCVASLCWRIFCVLYPSSMEYPFDFVFYSSFKLECNPTKCFYVVLIAWFQFLHQWTQTKGNEQLTQIEISYRFQSWSRFVHFPKKRKVIVVRKIFCKIAISIVNDDFGGCDSCKML